MHEHTACLCIHGQLNFSIKSSHFGNVSYVSANASSLLLQKIEQFLGNSIIANAKSDIRST